MNTLLESVKTLVEEADRLQQAGRHADAAALLRQAVAAAPEDPEPRFRLANALLAGGRGAEAEALYREILPAHPRPGRVLTHLGLALLQRGQVGPAEQAVRRALQLNPNLAEAHVALAQILVSGGDPGEAEQAGRRAIALNPDTLDAHAALALSLVLQHRLDEARAVYEAATARFPQVPEVHSNLLWMLNDTDNLAPEAVFEAHREWGRRHGAGFVPPKHANAPDPERPLRVAVITSHLRRAHPAATFLTALFQFHDRRALALTVYWVGGDLDDVGLQFRAWSDAWVDAAPLDDDALAARIQADGIDVLIERGGHGGSYCRLMVHARKPAPIQVAWMGYQNTRGLEAIDYFLADAICCPPETQRFLVERIYTVPGPMIAYLPIPAPAETPPAVPAPDAGILFGVFARSVKVQPGMLRLWATLLQRVPNARILFKSPGYRSGESQARIRAPFLDAGISANRVEFQAFSPRQDYLEALGKLDVLLDTFPNTGATVTLDGLWMGVPTVTLRGTTAVSRMGHALLTHVGHPEWVADTEQAYLDIAVSLASDPSALARIRGGLRAELETSPLRDGVGHARALEAAFRDMWRRWCAGQGT